VPPPPSPFLHKPPAPFPPRAPPPPAPYCFIYNQAAAGTENDEVKK